MRRFTQRWPRMVLLFLIIEFLDEMVFGVTEAAWPLIRDDLGLSYTQIGLALTLPGLVSIFIEPVLGALGDGARRRTLVLGGGVAFCVALALYAVAPSFPVLLLAMMLFYPASGAFVSLSQATLMDLDPQRHEQNMARWTFAGSAGVVTGPLLLSLFILLGLGWRGAMGGLAFVSLAVLLLAWRGFPLKPLQLPENAMDEKETNLPLLESLRRALLLLKRGEVLRWVVLLEFSDLMLDVLYSFLALYFVDVVKMDPGAAALAVSVWTVVGLAGDFLLIPLLERVKGLDYLRVSVVLELILYPAFLLVEPLWLKFVLLGLLGFFNSGWYSILKGNLYGELGKQSAAILVLDNAVALVARFIPLGLGLVAQRFGLGSAMWLLLLGPLALLVGLPRKKKDTG